MTDAGFRARIFSVEWHAELLRRHGKPLHDVRAMMQHCNECVAADFYGLERPAPNTGDPMLDDVLVGAEAYFDRLFSSTNGPQSFA